METLAGTERTFTEKVLNAYSKIEDPRLRCIVSTLVKHLHACVTELKVTDLEWELALVRLAQP